MPGPGETKAAVIKLDPPESFSKGGVVIGFTSLETEARQEFNKINNKDGDPNNQFMGESVVACGDEVLIGWIYDGTNFRDPNS